MRATDEQIERVRQPWCFQDYHRTAPLAVLSELTSLRKLADAVEGFTTGGLDPMSVQEQRYNAMVAALAEARK